jgi:dTDP-4-dehydrorhamnose reductase
MINSGKKVILVFGGSGLLGAHCHHLLKHNFKLILTYNSNQILSDNFVFFNALDSSVEIDKLLVKYRPDIIINALGFVTVDGCETNPEIADRLNVGFVKDLVISLKKNNLDSVHLIQISSDSVYGQIKNNNTKPWAETDPLEPMSVYANTKMKSEAEAFYHSGPVSVLRVAFYGINPYSKDSLLWFIIENAINNKKIDGWQNIYFSPISAISFVEKIQLIIESTITGTFNIGSSDFCNKFDFIEAVFEGIGHKGEINPVINNPFNGPIIRPEYSVLDSKKLSAIIPLELSWRKDLNRYLKNSLKYPI